MADASALNKIAAQYSAAQPQQATGPTFSYPPEQDAANNGDDQTGMTDEQRAAMIQLLQSQMGKSS